MIKIKEWLLDNLYLVLTIFLSLIILTTFLFYRLAKIPNQYSLGEKVIRHNLIAHSYSLDYLWKHVVYAPYYLFMIVPQTLHGHGLFSVRSVGVFFGIISSLVFFYIIWRWWGNLIAVLSTILFTTSFWFLQTSRNSGAEILYVLAALMVIMLGFVVRNKKRHETKTLLSALLAIVLLYIPGMIWFILAACFLQRKFMFKEFVKLPTQVKFIVPIASLILVIPLVHYCYGSIDHLKTLLGFPLHFSAKTFVKNLVNWPITIFIRNPNLSGLSLGHLPILNVFSTIMFVLGLYWIWLKRSLDRIYLFGASIILAWLLYALGGPVSIFLGIPFIMCIVATGLAFALSQWFTVFPRNPVARSLGMSVIILAVVTVGLLNINEYFIAWPNAPTTTAIYSTH